MFSLKVPTFSVIFFLTASCRYALLPAQTLGGVAGLVRAPSAEIMRDGTFYLGASFLPKEILDYTGHQRDGLVVFSSLTFLPFLEFNLRLTRQLNLPQEATHTVDRSPGLRLRLLRQSQTLPSLVLGFHDLFSTVDQGQARHFAATYLVITRRFEARQFYLSPTVGYSHPLYANRRSEFEGVFGGFKVQPKSIAAAALLEYLNQSINLGIDLRPTRWAQLKVALLDGRYISCNVVLHFNLSAVFKNW